MRPDRAAVAALGVLLCLAACDGTTSPTFVTPTASAGVSTSAPTPPRPGVPLRADTRAICAEAFRARDAFGKTILADLQARQAAAGKDASARAAAQRTLTRDVTRYSRTLAGLAGRAHDAALKKALTEVSRQATALEGDLAKVDGAALSAGTAALDRACGRA